jgi:asparagine synthase (glutamine-hydrolysing)
MPGIAGIITKHPNRPDAEGEVLAMVDCMLHEPFYTCGTYSFPEIGCYVGWVSHKKSLSDCNPIVSGRGDIALIFSGEHFAAQDGHAGEPASHSTTAANLLASYEQQGAGFLSDLNGWFAGVLIDRRQKRATVFNDRFGLHRIYYTETADAFVFASEAKAVLAICQECRTLDATAAGQFVTFGSVFQNRTLFSGVLLLPGASAWTFGPGPAASKRRYFDAADWENQPAITPREYYADLKSTLSRIVPQYCRAPQTVGMSLTGGLDTRIIMAATSPGERIPCYTYGGGYRECFDVKVAADIAAVSRQQYQVIPLRRDFFDAFAELAEKTVWLTDGCLDICGTHELYYSARAREIAQIRITGNYGSEVLRGVSTFKSAPPSGAMFAGELRPYIDEALRSYAALHAGHPATFAAMYEIPWHLYGRLAVAQTQLTVRSPYMDNELVRLVYRAPLIDRQASDSYLRLIADLSPALGAVETDMGYRSTASPLQTFPRRLYRYALFKAEWYYNFGMPRWLAPSDFLLRRFEPLFLGSHKIEHYRVWFRDRLAGYVREMLSDSQAASRPYARNGSYEKLINTEALSGQDTLDVSRLITLELIQRLFLGSTSRVARQARMASVRVPS